MSVLQAFLCGFLYFIAIGNLPFVGLWTIQRPLVCGLLTGVILGDPLKGAMVGATINLVYLALSLPVGQCRLIWRYQVFWALPIQLPAD